MLLPWASSTVHAAWLSSVFACYPHVRLVYWLCLFSPTTEDLPSSICLTSPGKFMLFHGSKNYLWPYDFQFISPAYSSLLISKCLYLNLKNNILKTLFLIVPQEARLPRSLPYLRCRQLLYRCSDQKPWNCPWYRSFTRALHSIQPPNPTWKCICHMTSSHSPPCSSLFHATVVSHWVVTTVCTQHSSLTQLLQCKSAQVAFSKLLDGYLPCLQYSMSTCRDLQTCTTPTTTLRPLKLMYYALILAHTIQLLWPLKQAMLILLQFPFLLPFAQTLSSQYSLIMVFTHMPCPSFSSLFLISQQWLPSDTRCTLLIYFPLHCTYSFGPGYFVLSSFVHCSI